MGNNIAQFSSDSLLLRYVIGTYWRSELVQLCWRCNIFNL